MYMVNFPTIYFPVERGEIDYLTAPNIGSLHEPPREKANKMACAPSEDSYQPGHPPSLIRVFAVRSVDS